MADISGYIRNIEIASRGEEVRDSIVGALNGMNDSIAPSVEAALLDAKESGAFDGDKGDTGPAGPFFTPSVSNGGVISWTNNGGLDNPPSINIKGPKGDTGDAGAPGQPGTDGESPVITVTNITGGHRITIVDEAHPSGQIIDVMDGTGSGDMKISVFDPDGDVEAAGGIAEYVAANAQTALTFDSTPTEHSQNPVTSHGIYMALHLLIQKMNTLEGKIESLTDRVTRLEGGGSTYVEDNYLVSDNGSVTDHLLEIAGAVYENNYLVMGDSSSSAKVEDGILSMPGASLKNGLITTDDEDILLKGVTQNGE